LTWNSWLSGMKSFRDDLNGRMRTGKGRFVLASSAVQKMYTRVQRFYQLVSPRPLMVAKFNSNTFIKKFWSRFVRVWLQSLQKFNMGIKNPKFYNDLESVEKVKQKNKQRNIKKWQKKWSFCLLFLCIKVFSL
jgi:hypothetical protein